MNEETVFEAASLSKPVTAYAALKLVDRGLLHLDRPLAEHLVHPDLVSDPRASRITLRMVLSHTTGLQNERIGNEPLALQFEPGQRFRYSGEAFQYLAMVMEKVTGTSFPELVRREVFGPLMMTHSSFTLDESSAGSHAIGHDQFGDRKKPNPAAAPNAAASLRTTANDYSRFLLAVMKSEGLSQSTWAEMIKPQVTITDNIAWGLGWALVRTRAGWLMWHHGDNSNTGFTSFAAWTPGDDHGMVYFANSNSGLGITGRILEWVGEPLAAAAPAVTWMNYEKYDSPVRRARILVERVIRTEGVAAGLQRWEELKEASQPGTSNENFLNDLGYRFMGLARLDDAIALFKENVRLYPSSFNAYDSLGEAYVAIGDYSAALHNYQRSVELNSAHTHGLNMIRQLRAKLQS